MKSDLNKLFKIRSHTKKSHDGITVSFDENVEYVCSKIKKSQVVVGCAPWFSNKRIIKALSNVSDGISIILDKSTLNQYIRSNSASCLDVNEVKQFYFEPLPIKISSLPTDFNYTPIDAESINKCAFRVIGRDQSQQEYKTFFHYKFLVFCEITKSQNIIQDISPKSVICGSFNFSENAAESREALLYIENSDVALEFYDEWARAFILSENVENFGEELNPEFLPAKTEEEVLRLLAQDDNYEMMEYAHENRHEQEALMIEKAASPYW